jgi:hypothetical protein
VEILEQTLWHIYNSLLCHVIGKFFIFITKIQKKLHGMYNSSSLLGTINRTRFFGTLERKLRRVKEESKTRGKGEGRIEGKSGKWKRAYQIFYAFLILSTFCSAT